MNCNLNLKKGILSRRSKTLRNKLRSLLDNLKMKLFQKMTTLILLLKRKRRVNVACVAFGLETLNTSIQIDYVLLKF